MVSALVNVGRVDVHQVRPADGGPAALDHVHLNRNVRDVFVLRAGGGLDLDEVESLPSGPSEYVRPGPDALEGERRLVQGRHGGVGQQGLRRPHRLGMLEVLLPDEHAAGKSLPCQLADGGPGVENRLLSRLYRVGKLAMIALEIEPFQALQASKKPGL